MMWVLVIALPGIHLLFGPIMKREVDRAHQIVSIGTVVIHPYKSSSSCFLSSCNYWVKKPALFQVFDSTSLIL